MPRSSAKKTSASKPVLSEKQKLAQRLKVLQNALEGKLFSEENAPGLLERLQLPDELDSMDELNALMKSLKLNTQDWLLVTYFYPDKIAAIRDASKNYKWVNWLFHRPIFNSKDNQVLEKNIEQKLKWIKSAFAFQKRLTQTLLIIGYTLLSIILLGIPLFKKFRKPFVGYLKNLFANKKVFLEKDFDVDAKTKSGERFSLFEKKFEQTYKDMLIQRNVEDLNTDQHVTHLFDIPKDVLQSNLLRFLTEEEDVQSLSMASRLLRDIIYHSPKHRFCHKPTPTKTEHSKSDSDIVFTWDNGTTLYREQNRIRHIPRSYLVLKNKDQETLYETQELTYDKPFKIRESKLITFSLTGQADHHKAHIIDTETGKIITSPPMHKMGFYAGYHGTMVYFLSNTSDTSYEWDTQKNTIRPIEGNDLRQLHGTEITRPDGNKQYICAIIGKKCIKYILANKKTPHPINAKGKGFQSIANPYKPSKLIGLKNNQYIGLFRDEKDEWLAIFSIEEKNNKSRLGLVQKIFKLEDDVYNDEDIKHYSYTYEVSEDEKILVIYHKVEDKHCLIFYDLENLSTISKLDATQDFGKSKCSNIYFDQHGGLVCETEDFTLTYPYGTQAKETEEDRQAVMGRKPEGPGT